MLVRLTPEEVTDLGEQLCAALEELENQEAEAKQVKADLKATSEELNARVKKLASRRRSGREQRAVDIETVIDYNVGTKTVRRLDTGDVLDKKELTDDERQRHFDFLAEQEEQAEDDTEQPETSEDAPEQPEAQEAGDEDAGEPEPDPEPVDDGGTIEFPTTTPKADGGPDNRKRPADCVDCDDWDDKVGCTALGCRVKEAREKAAREAEGGVTDEMVAAARQIIETVGRTATATLKRRMDPTPTDDQVIEIKNRLVAAGFLAPPKKKGGQYTIVKT
jgi:hypothetical protein